jgi:glycosyltransferase involved in cell wall biosynthesis
MNNISNEHVAVLLCCYQGKKFIAEQIDSIFGQTHKNISLWVSIDGSDDGTREIIEERARERRVKQLHIVSGPGKGFAANFWSLLCNQEIKADYYSFCDQDDIWESNKLSRALEFLRAAPQKVPAIYCSRSSYIDESGTIIGQSAFFKKKPSFKSALVQSLSAGNTMVFNRESRDIIVKHCKNVSTSFHDWLTYLIVSAVGGTVIYDAYLGLRYRQHGQNLYGENFSLSARFRRVRLVMNGTFRMWNDLNIQSLEKIQHLMTKENQKIFDLFKGSRNKWALSRVFWLWKAGICRHSFFQNVILYFACLINRI